MLLFHGQVAYAVESSAALSPEAHVQLEQTGDVSAHGLHVRQIGSLQRVLVAEEALVVRVSHRQVDVGDAL